MSDLQAIVDFILTYKWYTILIGIGVAAWYILKTYGSEFFKSLLGDMAKKDADIIRQRIDISDNTRNYLEQAITAYSRFKFRGLPTHVARTDANRLSLDQAYVSLRILAQKEHGAEDKDEITQKEVTGQVGRLVRSEALSLPQTLQEFKQRRLAIIGIAGSGKSTLLQWAGLACARALLGMQLNTEQKELIEVLEGEAPFPIFIPLRAYNEYCRQNKVTRSVKSLLNFLSAHFSEDQVNCEFTAEFFKMHLQKNCLIMFDGVDEVESEDRPGIQLVVEKLLDTFNHPQLHCLISSRPSASYVSDQMADFQRCEVQRLTSEQRHALIQFWHRAIYHANLSVANKKAEELSRRIQNATAQVQELATTPLMVTIFCMVNYSHDLPRLRAQLYEDAIQVLLTDTIHHEGDFYKGLEQWGGKEWGDRRDHLAFIAFNLQEQNVIKKPESDLVEMIWDNFGAEPEAAQKSAREFLSSVAQRGGLLEAVDNDYGFFTHSTFQEYLAGRYLAEEKADKEQADFLEQHFMNDKWWEAIRLAAGYLSIGGKNKADAFVKMLAGLGKTPEEKAQALALAGECLVDMRKREFQTAEDISGQIETMIGINPPQAPVGLRYRLGLALGSLGDPRLKPLEPDCAPVPAGAFRMGTSEEQEKLLREQNVNVYGDEKPSHLVYVSDFAIGRYPVTNLEFAAFYDAKGYENQDYWSRDGWNWRTGKWEPELSFLPDEDLRKTYKDWLARRPVELRDGPFYREDLQWNTPNLPVVGISWFEAEAYCRWLSQVTGKPYRLPTEAEWEKAARGAGNFLWSWGNSWNGDLCNNADENTTEKLNRTSPVGMYPDGMSSYGALDMMGNVWEWCYDWFAEDTYEKQAGQEVRDPKGAASGSARVVRGGSWVNSRNLVRCAVRGWLSPGIFDYSVGFRMVLSPDKSS